MFKHGIIILYHQHQYLAHHEIFNAKDGIMLVNPIYSEYLQTGTLASSEYPNSISSVFALFVKKNQQSPGTN